ncbi:H3 protein, partial [Ardeotis kori]|nr:H3 protein [Ardeotis kori]
ALRQAPPLRKKFGFLRKRSPRLLPAASLRELARGFFQSREGFGVQAAAAAALREGCEAHLLALLEEWGLCALHAGRAAVRRADVHLVRCLRVKRG